jgi:hypothetical protein
LGGQGSTSSPTLTFTGTGAFSGSTSNSNGALGTYSMLEAVTSAFNGPGTASFDYSADNTLIPEPSSLTLAVLGVLGLVGYSLESA